MSGRKSAYDAKVRADVDARDEGKCRRCGTAGGQISRHHRKPRGMGGANRADSGRLSNIVTLCGSGTTGCHGWVETHREEARGSGWLVFAVDDPQDVPMVDVHGRRFALLDSGTVRWMEPVPW